MHPVRLKPLIRLRPWSVAALALAVVVCAAAAVQVVLTLVGSFSLGFGLVLAIPRVLECGLVAFGLVLIARGAPYRLGASMHCARCGYQRVEERDRLLINCPECGHHWRLFGGWRTGRPLGSPRLVRIGLLVCVVGLGAISARGLASRWLAERMTTGMLIRHVLFAPTDSAVTAWEILGRRALTEAEIRWLGDDLLRRRRERGALDRRSVEWIHGRIADSTLGPELSARYFDESADFWIEAEPAGVGQTLTAAVRGVYRGPAIDTPDGPVTFAVEGITIELPGPGADDARTDFERRYQTGPLLLVMQDAGMVVQDPLGVRRNLKLASAAATAQFAGTAKIKAAVWVLVGPKPGEPLQWRAEGSRMVPVTDSPHHRAIRRELSHEVAIGSP